MYGSQLLSAIDREEETPCPWRFASCTGVSNDWLYLCAISVPEMVAGWCQGGLITHSPAHTHTGNISIDDYYRCIILILLKTADAQSVCHLHNDDDDDKEEDDDDDERRKNGMQQNEWQSRGSEVFFY